MKEPKRQFPAKIWTKSVRLRLRLGADVLDAATAAAERAGVSICTWIRIAIHHLIDEERRALRAAEERANEATRRLEETAPTATTWRAIATPDMSGITVGFSSPDPQGRKVLESLGAISGVLTVPRSWYERTARALERLGCQEVSLGPLPVAAQPRPPRA